MQYPESYYAVAAPGQQSLSEGSSDIARCITDKNPLPPPIVSNAVPKKPIRPLTAYHIFFQIEREFIIQTCAGQDEDVSIDDGKVYLAHVPPRYRKIKLLPLWYAGPGRRPKRKHRKRHGKISFLDLSRAISARWAKLEEVDPETKRFVERIARQEIEIYYHEMKHYREITNAPQAPTGAVPGSQRKSKHIALPTPQAPPVSAASNMETAASKPASMKQLLDELASSVPGSDVTRLSSDSSVHQIHRRRKMAQHRQNSMEQQRQNSLMVQHRENSLSLSNLDPIMVAVNFMDASKKRRTGTDASYANPVMAEVDIPDAEILSMWLSQNTP